MTTVPGKSSAPDSGDFPVFAVLIYDARLQLGLTQRAVANAVGVYGSTYGNWELGKHVPKRQHIEPLAVLLDIPAELLQEAYEVLKANNPIYNLWKRKAPEERAPKKPNGPCNVPGCKRRRNSFGLCLTHHVRLLRWGDVAPEIPVRQRIGGSCSIARCLRPVYGWGMCQAHWTRKWRTGDAGDAAIMSRPSVVLDAFGERKTVPEWAKDHRCAVTRHALLARIKLGWSAEKAITQPPKPYGRARPS